MPLVNVPVIGGHRMAIRVTDDLRERLEAQATRESNHVSAVARRLLTKALDQEDAASPARRPKK